MTIITQIEVYISLGLRLRYMGGGGQLLKSCFVPVFPIINVFVLVIPLKGYRELNNIQSQIVEIIHQGSIHL